MSNETTEKAYDYREDPEYWRAPFDFTKPLFDVNTPEGWMRAELKGRFLMLRLRAPVPNMSGVWQRLSVGMKLRNSPSGIAK